MTNPAAREAEFLEKAFRDPAWLLQEIDINLDRAAFVPVDERAYRESPFLDHRLQGARGRPVVTHFHRLEEAGNRAPLHATHWIFHPGHVGSTLLSRYLGEMEALLPVREPLPLRNLAAMWREQGDPLAQLGPDSYARFERALLAVQGRVFRNGQVALVKATSDCCNLLWRALAVNDDNRAVWIDVDLETFLAGMLRNDARREETRAFAQSRLRDLHHFLGDRRIRLHELGPGELTAVSWLASQGHRIAAMERVRGERVLRLHFHELLDDAAAVLGRVLAHLGVAADDATLKRLLASRWAGAYAKEPANAFGAADRYRQLAASRRDNREAIAAGMALAERLCRHHPELAPLSDDLAQSAGHS